MSETVLDVSVPWYRTLRRHEFGPNPPISSQTAEARKLPIPAPLCKSPPPLPRAWSGHSSETSDAIRRDTALCRLHSGNDGVRLGDWRRDRRDRRRLHRSQADDDAGGPCLYPDHRLSAIAWNWESFAILRFLVGIGIGSEWVTGAAMLYYGMCLILTPVVYLWTQSLGPLLVAVAIFGFFSVGIWAWAPIWLPELFPTRMRGTAVAFCYNAPRWISCTGPLIAGTLIVALGGYGPAATLVALFFIVGFVTALFLPETKGKPLLDTV